MNIALAQMDVVPGRPKKNIEAMLEMILLAKENRADLVAFPEMCVGGYLVGDKWTSDAFCDNLMEFDAIIREASKGIAVAYGNIFVDHHAGHRMDWHGPGYHPNKDGRLRKYNAAHVVQNGRAARRAVPCILPDGIQPKTLLPAYRFFDDSRYFFSTQDIAIDAGVPLETLLQPFLIEMGGKMVPVGFELCEDLWCEDYRKDGEALNPTKMLIDNGAEMIVNLSASPWTFGKAAARDRRVMFLKEEAEKEGGRFVPFFYVNCVGAQNNGKNIITFDGGSTVYNADGKPVRHAAEPYAQELMVISDAELSGPAVMRTSKPKIAEKYDAIIRGIQHIKDMRGREEQPRYVIGLSGGIDSAVIAALLVKAVGRDKVAAINMPTRYNSEKTKDAARRIAENLCITYDVVPIGDLVDLNEAIVDAHDLDGSGRRLSTLNSENVQAKIRATAVLSNIAAKYGAYFTCNGNKLEIALGYATLYGDVGGAIAPIGDLAKSEVYELARYINTEVFGKEVIPETLILDALFWFRDDQIRPSAELKADQVDPMKFGYHCALLEALLDYRKHAAEDILRWYLQGALEEKLGISTALIKRWGIDDPAAFIDDLEWFVASIERNVFKRVQAPPNVVTSKTAYGYDLRESIMPGEQTQESLRLRRQVLAMDRYMTKGGANA